MFRYFPFKYATLIDQMLGAGDWNIRGLYVRLVPTFSNPSVHSCRRSRTSVHDHVRNIWLGGHSCNSWKKTSLWRDRGNRRSHASTVPLASANRFVFARFGAYIGFYRTLDCVLWMYVRTS